MAKDKLRLRLYTILFCVLIFLLTAVGLAVMYYRMLVLPLWFTLVYIAAWALILALAVDFFVSHDKFSGKKLLLLTLGVVLISTIVTHSVWFIVTPRWSFSISTDKSIYRLGENVEITASLRNMGFIAHSFKSASSNPIVVSADYQYTGNPTQRSQVWYSSISKVVTEFSMKPEETLERNFVWNQTNIYRPEEVIQQGIYWISATVPKDSSDIGFDNLFSAWTTINIISG